ncbi:MAG: hypothetical protein QM638_18555 [Nocardioides sp.]|uniref:hypothetical protein n=1 Tax=Nocardioides sp. TaxID=35761 RepID=UPI0039E56A4D
MHESDDRGEGEAGADRSGAGGSDEDSAWREIVENYGERAVLTDTDTGTGTAEPADDPAADDERQRRLEQLFVVEFDEDEEPAPIYLEDSERYVPPPPPPLPRTTPERAAAWIGVLGAPVAAVVLVVVHMLTGLEIPALLTGFLVVAFLGGFGYLVATMPREPDDPWDDGARV